LAWTLATRQDLNEIINRLILQGTQVILTTSFPDFPESITHILELEKGKIKQACTKEMYTASKQAISMLPTPENETLLLPLAPKEEPDFQIAFRFKEVTVKYGEKKALDNINWTVNKGEKWALLGPNGSGKSTLLNLINGDHPQAYANNILLFDKPRGTGESIWEIKKRIGYVSPELHLYFRQNLPCWEVAATGYMDTLYLNKKITDRQTDNIKKHFEFLGISHLLQQNFQHVSSGQQRLVLLIRSLIKQPDVIIWDEPYQALDIPYIKLSAQLLQVYCTASTTLIFVSHYIEEIPPFVHQYLYLDQGRVSEQQTVR
jgi:molybdate transport system ATP-binding protein